MPSARARLAHAVDDLGELPHHLGVLRVAEVQAVDERAAARRPTHATLRAASSTASRPPVRGSSAAEAGLAVGGERERAVGVPFSRSTAASPPGPTTVLRNSWWSYWRAHPRLVGDRRRARAARAARAERSVPAGNRARELGRRDRRPGRASWSAGRAERPVVHRSVTEAPDRDVGDRAAVGRHLRRLVADRRRRVLAGHTDRVEQPVVDAEAAGVGDPTDDRRAGSPTAAHSASTSSRFVGRDDREHPLLALGRHHLDRVHARLAAGARARRRRPCPRRSSPRSPTPRTRARRRRGPARRPRGRRRAARGTPR